MNGSLYIVDALNYLFRAFHALPPLRSSTGLNTGALLGLCTMIERIEREQKPTHLCVVQDAPGRTFRDELYVEYKAHRPPMPPELAEQVALLPRVLETLGLPMLTVAGFEADDVIATVAKQAVASGLAAVICSSDKDLMQLCCDGITILDTMKNKVLGRAEVEEKFGVPPEQVGDVLALVGDSIDNVPGVDGIGPKTAADLIRKYGTLDNLLEHAGEVKGKRGEALVAAKELVRVSRKLVELHTEVPLPVPLSALARRPIDRDARIQLFRELEFKRLLEQELALVDKDRGGAAQPAAPASAAPPGEAAATPEAPPLPAAPPATEIVLDEAALARLVAAAVAAGRVGIAVLLDAPEPLRAGLVGVALALPGGAHAYVPTGHRVLGGPRTLSEATALAALTPLFADPAVEKHVHDAKLLEVWLGLRGHALVGVKGDPLLAAYLLDASRARYDLEVVAPAAGVGGVFPRASWMGTGRTARPVAERAPDEVAGYLASEAVATLALGPLQHARLAETRLLELYEGIELPLSHVLARVERHGVRLDVAYLHQLGQEVAESILALEREIHALAGQPFNIGSPKQLQEILFGKLGLPIIRKTKTGASTDADVLEELATLHAVPAKILEYRGLTKLKGTYIDAFPALLNPRTGRLHTTFHQAVAATGRLSSSDPNLQNIPIRSEVGRRIRRAFIADAGYRIVSADYSQIELRILAHVSEDPAFLDAFRSGQDVHQRTAAEVFGLELAQVTSEQRRIAKAINFGLVFGQTDFGLAQVLRIPRAEAKAYIQRFFERYAGVRAYMERAIGQARETGEVSTLLGRRRPLPEIRASRPQDRAYAERIARNSPIQGSAADLLKLAMIRVDAGLGAFPGARLLLTVHDELVFEVPEAQVASFEPWVKHEMEAVQTLKVPLVVDLGAGTTWGDAH